MARKDAEAQRRGNLFIIKFGINYRNLNLSIAIEIERKQCLFLIRIRSRGLAFAVNKINFSLPNYSQ